MEISKVATNLRLAAANIITNDIQLADHIYDLADLVLKGEAVSLNFTYVKSKRVGYNPRTRIKLLANILTELADVYFAVITPKQLAYANDLIDEVEIGFLRDTDNDSDFARELKQTGLTVSAEDAEISLKLRIVRLIEDVMSCEEV